MCPERVIRRFAGIFILVSLVLGWLASPVWLLFTAFVGLNLLQSSVTDFCPLERVLGGLHVLGCRPRGTAATG
jgi:hypothetical protein